MKHFLKPPLKLFLAEKGKRCKLWSLWLQKGRSCRIPSVDEEDKRPHSSLLCVSSQPKFEEKKCSLVAAFGRGGMDGSRWEFNPRRSSPTLLQPMPWELTDPGLGAKWTGGKENEYSAWQQGWQETSPPPTNTSWWEAHAWWTSVGCIRARASLWDPSCAITKQDGTSKSHLVAGSRGERPTLYRPRERQAY